MGLLDKAKEARAEMERAMEESAVAAQQSVARCPNPRIHYLSEVNKGSINMAMWQGHLNQMYSKGYRLAQSFEQDGNTVQVYEHHFHE